MRCCWCAKHSWFFEIHTFLGWDICSSFFNVTFWFPKWRSLKPWKGHKNGSFHEVTTWRTWFSFFLSKQLYFYTQEKPSVNITRIPQGQFSWEKKLKLFGLPIKKSRSLDDWITRIKGWLVVGLLVPRFPWVCDRNQLVSWFISPI